MEATLQLRTGALAFHSNFIEGEEGVCVRTVLTRVRGLIDDGAVTWTRSSLWKGVMSCVRRAEWIRLLPMLSTIFLDRSGESSLAEQNPAAATRVIAPVEPGRGILLAHSDTPLWTGSVAAIQTGWSSGHYAV